MGIQKITVDRSALVVEIWQEFLSLIREEVGSRVVETWLKAVSLKEWNAESQTVTIQAPNLFVRDWIQSKYVHLFRIHLARLLHVHELKVVFCAESDKEKEEILLPVNALAVSLQRKSIPKKVKNALTYKTIKNYGQLNPHYRFETFIVGPSNALAYAAAQSIANNPGDHYNPFFVYGGSGLGKTHLLHAIGNAIQERDSKAVVFYQTTDRFVNEFISSIRMNKTHVFQQKYRMVDVLLIDDIQFISKKEQTQEAFFHIFNTLYDTNKQIIFSSDMFPRDIVGLEERLCSRLEWGLVVDVHVPQLETKIAILKKKAQEHGIELDDSLAEAIAHYSVSNIRELEGALVRVIAFASITKQNISLEMIEKVLQRVSLHTIKESTINFEKIVSCVCRHYSYRIADLRSSSRAKELSFVRQVAMYLMKKMTDRSLREIGNFLGRKDHSTVIHAFEKITDSLTNDRELQQIITHLETQINQ